jgi:putative transposase
MIELGRSTYQYKPKISREERDRRDQELRDLIEQIHLEMPKAGYRTLHEYLWRGFGRRINEKKIRRVQKKFNLFAEIKRAFIHTTDSKHPFPVYENLIKDFRPIATNVVWVADITYIKIQSGFLYLATVMDLYSRKIIGWAISRRIDEELTIEALQMAIQLRNPSAGVIHHSDRGVQYCSMRYRQVLSDSGIRPSCSRKGNPYDNAAMERFMRTLKQEEVYLRHYETIEDVVENIPRFIEEIYNKKRVHSSLGYLTPEEFEAKQAEKQKQSVVQDLS